MYIASGELERVSRTGICIYTGLDGKVGEGTGRGIFETRQNMKSRCGAGAGLGVAAGSAELERG